jgi:hypothetical protein
VGTFHITSSCTPSGGTASTSNTVTVVWS